jgi:hypothetical protein
VSISSRPIANATSSLCGAYDLYFVREAADLGLSRKLFLFLIDDGDAHEKQVSFGTRFDCRFARAGRHRNRR